MGRFKLALVLLLGASACTYVTRGAFEEKRDALDEDADGSVRKVDCDDQNPMIAPTAPEIPYDGIDNDCVDGDVVDIDGDGFPGIAEADYPGEFPEALKGKPVDCADDPALVERADRIAPDPSIDEQPYDGIDSNCDRSNDFDEDGDGYMPTWVRDADGSILQVQALMDAYILQWGITEAEVQAWLKPSGLTLDDPLAFEDCDDFDAALRPGSGEVDTPYDGIDRDCDDANDFDADGDGFMPPGVEADYAEYVERYYLGQAPPFLVPSERAFEDCLDMPDPSIVALPKGTPVDPADVHPNTAEAPITDVAYDAVDSDCLRNNDFDTDSDGFMPDGYDKALQAYIAAWNITDDEVLAWAAVNVEAALDAPASGDCNDSDALVWPGALEQLSDKIDQDCDGNADASAFGFSDYTWTDPTNPEAGRLGDNYLLLIGSAEAQLEAPTTRSGVGIPFFVSDARGGPEPSVTTFPNWKGNPLTVLHGAIDAAPDPAPVDVDNDGLVDPILYVATTYNNDFQSWVYLSGVQLRTVTNSLLPPTQSLNNLAPIYVATDVDIAFDNAIDPQPFTLACAPTRMHALYSATNTSSLEGADLCFFEEAPTENGSTWSVPFTRCLNNSCDAWTLAGTPDLTQGATLPDSWMFGDFEMGWLVRIAANGDGWLTDTVNATDLRIMDGYDVVYADVSEYNGLVYIAAITDSVAGIEVWLQYGKPGSMETQVLPFEHPTLPNAVPSSIAVHADADRVMIAVTALDPDGNPDSDVVGWVFLGP